MIARELIAVPSFASEVEQGLTSFPKTLPSKLFYDAAGSVLFEKITELPEYYLTRTELGILRKHASAMARAVSPDSTIVELGAGTAAKTCTLLRAFAKRQMRVMYFPVDISWDALAEARERVSKESPQTCIRPVVADFSDGFGFLHDIPGRKLVLYLGSSIGNFETSAAIDMLRSVRSELSSGDALLLGTDLVKDPAILVPAYDDAQDVTSEFNKNLLRRFNRELDADFDLASFRHVAKWNAKYSRMEMHLESLEAQIVNLRSLNLHVRFANGERIHTENSYKYTLDNVREMLTIAGFSPGKTWLDRKKWFALHLARV
ncbi:MAG: L-histidine N(alpha)-methyltransferase [Terriglobales bacterium]|jgi:dimethylhistidine N-methyltransferase